MTSLTAHIEGIGLLGPGLPDWPAAAAVLLGQEGYRYRDTALPAPAALPPAERRRCGAIVKLSLAVGLEAAHAAGADPAALPTVFSASGGDGANCHEICQMLASSDRLISPTRFHNSVHNSASGYWSIATGAMAPSSVLCAYDASFGAGLLEAAAQAAVERCRVLLIAGDTTYPEPLHRSRPIPTEFGVALVLAPEAGPRTIARISVALTQAGAERLEDPALEQVRAAIPAARSLPLLRALARRESGAVVLDYLDGNRLAVEVAPCP